MAFQADSSRATIPSRAERSLAASAYYMSTFPFESQIPTPAPPFSGPPDRHDRHVVTLGRAAGEAINVLGDAADRVGRTAVRSLQRIEQALFAEHLFLRVERLD